ncbi:hypothetical protein [Sphingobium xenophagum]
MAAGHKTGGRKKGTPNKLTGQVKEMILEALDRKGGADYLERQAEENPVAFMGLVGKVLPMTVAGPGENGEHVITTITRRVVNASEG